LNGWTRSMKGTVPVAIMVGLVVTACGTPPALPDVDPSTRRPANTTAGIELQTCRSDLAEAKVNLAEQARAAQAARAALSQVLVERVLSQPGIDAAQPRLAGRVGRAAARADLGLRSVQPNVIWILRFAFNSAFIDVPSADLGRLTAAAGAAAFVVVKGRTDGAQESTGESQIARLRAAAMKAALVKGGVEPQKIAVQYQPIGDYVAPNNTEQGRAANRRVEIELYDVMPDRRLLGTTPVAAGARAQRM